MPGRRHFLLLAVSTIAVGLFVHWDGVWLTADTRDVLGDALWAAMIAWWIGAVAPRAWPLVRYAAAYGICVAVELSQMYHAPALVAVLATPMGHLVFGTGFDPRDLVAYAGGIAAAAVLEVAFRRWRPAASS